MRRVGELALGLVLCLAGASWGAECAGTVYLTLDTGNMGQAEDIARILAEEGVRATFFVANERTRRGDRALDASWGGYWRARAAEGHTFGNHTWSHHYARRDEGDRLAAVSVEGRPISLDRQSFCAELRRPDDAFLALTGQRLGGVWRAPGGRTTPQSMRWAAGCGFAVHVGWTEAGALGDDLPSDRFPNATLLKRALDTIRPGDILMMHLGVWDRREPFSAVLRPLLQGLKARKLCFAPLAVPAR